MLHWFRKILVIKPAIKINYIPFPIINTGNILISHCEFVLIERHKRDLQNGPKSYDNFIIKYQELPHDQYHKITFKILYLFYFIKSKA